MIEPRLAAETVSVLRLTARLRLSSAGWAEAEEALASVDEAVAAADEDALRDALFELDRLFRRPVERLGEPADDAPATPRVRDRVTDLVHRLTPEEPHPVDPPE